MSVEISRVQQAALDFVRPHEGFTYSDNPADPGGPTKGGMSLRLLRSLGMDIDGDGDIDADDIKNMSQQDRDAVFIREFWSPVFNSLSERLAVRIFDHAVVAGPAAAWKCLQNACNCMPSSLPPIKVDGKIGPLSLRKFEETAHEPMITPVYRAMRVGHFQQVVAANPSTFVFSAGWYARAIS